MGRVQGKVAIVTGGAMGMGEAHARTLVREGAKVVIVDIAADKGRAVAQDLGADALFIEHDVSDAAGWPPVVAAAEAAFGPVTVLVNNAGIIEVARVQDAGLEGFRRVMEVNLMGTLHAIQAVAPSMRKAGGGAIVNISSGAGLVGLPGMASYVTSKFAVSGLSKCAAIDLAEDGIRVNSVHPGPIETPMTAGSEPPTRQAIARKGRPDEVSAMVLFLASDEASYCTGGQYVVDGGWLNVVGEVASKFQ